MRQTLQQVLNIPREEGVQLELPGKQKPQCTLKGRVCTPTDDEALLVSESLMKGLLGGIWRPPESLFCGWPSQQLETAWQLRYGNESEDADSSVCWIEVETVLSTADVGEVSLCTFRFRIWESAI